MIIILMLICQNTWIWSKNRKKKLSVSNKYLFTISWFIFLSANVRTIFLNEIIWCHYFLFEKIVFSSFPEFLLLYLNTPTLILIPAPNEKPYHKFLKQNNIPYQKNLSKHFCFYGIPFGIIPIELDETYPVSQTEIVEQESTELLSEMVSIICNYIIMTYI